LESLSPFDVITARRRTINKHKEFIFQSNGEMIANTIYYDPSEAFEPWMPQIKRIELTNNAIRMYDEQGTILREDQLSTKQDSVMTMAATMAMPGVSQSGPQMTPLTASAIAELQSFGFNVQELQPNTWMLTNADTRIIYDHQEGRLRNEKLQNGIITQSIDRSFLRTPAGGYIPHQTIFKNYTTLASGACGAFVTKQTISNYVKGNGPLPLLSDLDNVAHGQSNSSPLQDENRENKETLNISIASRLEGIQLYPNPSMDIVNVIFPFSSEQNLYHLLLVDASGVEVKRITEQRNTSALAIDIAELPDGIYFLKISDAQKTVTKKIVKQ
jgi:hypothetical protein